MRKTVGGPLAVPRWSWRRYRGGVEFSVRRATDADQDVIRRAIHQAWRWRDPWSETDFRHHLALGRPDSYVDDFGHRLGDVGFIGERPTGGGQQVLGAAWYRHFTNEEHRDGYVASNIPEIVVAVTEEARGKGVGRALTTRLIHHATVNGLPGLSLHVSSENVRAQHLYRTMGFVVVDDSRSRGVVMLKEIPGLTSDDDRASS